MFFRTFRTPTSSKKTRSGDNARVRYAFADDPYYCGLRARVPNFVKTSNGKTKEIVAKDVAAGPKLSTAVPPSRYQQNSMMAALSNGHLATNAHYHHHNGQPAMWHTRSFDSGMGECSKKKFKFVLQNKHRLVRVE